MQRGGSAHGADSFINAFRYSSAAVRTQTAALPSEHGKTPQPSGLTETIRGSPSKSRYVVVLPAVLEFAF